MVQKILIASDHAGLELKKLLINELRNLPWQDLGTHNSDSVDYPDYAQLVCEKMLNEPTSTVGVLICGSGQGMAIKANRYEHIRAALCWSPEIAKLSKQHNNANILCLPGRFVDLSAAKNILKSFLETEFEGGRHQRRVDKLKC